MRITHAKFHNWRSSRDITFSLGKMTAFVGANNAGKTGILSALDFLMGANWPSIQRLEDKDFYGRSRKDGLQIRVWFEQQSDAPYSAWFNVAKEADGETGARIQFKKDGQVYNLTNKHRDLFPLIYIDAERSFDKQFGTSRYSIFGQALRKLEEHFSDQVGDELKTQLGTHLDAAQSLLRTRLYDSFVEAVSSAFREQLQHTQHQLKVDFKSFDPFNFYKSLHPFLTEGEGQLSATEAGSGLRNMIVLALFRAYGKTFRGDGMIAIEEPEMYLHPHAQRGLMRMFREIADNGTQILYSTHSSAFVDIERFDEVVIVERCPDVWDEELCTSVRSLSNNELIKAYTKNRPGEDIRIDGLLARYRHTCGAEHTEALFGRVIILVEGATEAACLPIYADALKVNLDALGISIVNARGKDGIESLYHLYNGLGFPVFVIFDNDVGKSSKGAKEREKRQVSNRRLTRLLELFETDEPVAEVCSKYAIMEGDFEATIKLEVDSIEPGLFNRLTIQSINIYGTESKPIIARYMADYLCNKKIVPPTINSIIQNIALLAGVDPSKVVEPSMITKVSDIDIDDDIPF